MGATGTFCPVPLLVFSVDGTRWWCCVRYLAACTGTNVRCSSNGLLAPRRLESAVSLLLRNVVVFYIMLYVLISSTCLCLYEYVFFHLVLAGNGPKRGSARAGDAAGKWHVQHRYVRTVQYVQHSWCSCLLGTRVQRSDLLDRRTNNNP